MPNAYMTALSPLCVSSVNSKNQKKIVIPECFCREITVFNFPTVGGPARPNSFAKISKAKTPQPALRVNLSRKAGRAKI